MVRSSSRPYRSRARDLLNKLVHDGWYSPDDLADVLVLSPQEVIIYREGVESIPLDRQLCLAAFLIECVPPLARAGHALRSQVKSAIGFQLAQGTTHASAPPRLFR